MKEKKLYYVEFGEPRPAGGFMSFQLSGNLLSSVYVVANDYNEAASKAKAYGECKQAFNLKSNIFTEDGSLKNNSNENQEIKIRAITIVSDDVIW